MALTRDEEGKIVSTYDDDKAAQAEKLCAQFGATHADLADFFDVSVRTVYRWVAKHEAFANAVRIGKEAADQRVEHSLYQRAVGMRIPAKKFFSYEGVSWAEDYEEVVLPDTKACIFWLCNRQPDRWNNQHMKGAGRFDDDTAPQSVTVNIVDGRAEPDPATS